MPAKLPQRIISIDILRIIAISMIVMAHIVVSVYLRSDFVGGSAWYASFLIITFSRLGVPIFFIISGYLLFNKKRSFQANIRHTFKRLIFPFLFWTGVTYFVFYLNNTLPKFNLDLILSGGGTEYYFLIGLSIIYLLSPFIKEIVLKSSDKKILLILSSLSLITVGQTYFTFLYNLPQFTILNYWFLGIFYFMYGQYVNKNRGVIKKQKLNLLLFAMPLLINTVYIYLIRKAGFTGDLYLESYFGPTVLLSSIGLFNLLISLDIKSLKPKLTHWLTIFSNLSFGIFLVHGIILDLVLHKTIINPYGVIKISLWEYLIFSILIVIGVSVTVSYILGKNKIGRFMLGQS